MWDWLDPEGAARQQLIEQQEFTKNNQEDAPKEQPKAATPGKPLPVNKSKPGGGTRYSVGVTPGNEGRVHAKQVIKTESSGSPLADVARDVLEQKDYTTQEGLPIDPSDKSFVHAPTMARAYGIDQSEPGWGMKGYGGKIISGLAKGIAPVVAGGMMGGRKGAMEAWQTAEKARVAESAERREQLADVSSDRIMREAYEMARMNYESDYNMGKTEMPFGDYLAQALEAMSASGSGGTLQTFIDTWGPEEGYRRYVESKHRPRSGGGGGEGTVWDTYTVAGLDGVPHQVRRKIPASQAPTGDPVQTVTDKEGNTTTKIVKPRPKASDF